MARSLQPQELAALGMDEQALSLLTDPAIKTDPNPPFSIFTSFDNDFVQSFIL